MLHRRHRRSQVRRAFTLLEILLVVMILAVIAGFVITNVFATQDEAYKQSAKVQISDLENKVKQYRMKMKSYPSELNALHVKPSDAGSGDWYQIIDKPVPDDPWGKPYSYKVSGTDVEIRSSGPDGQMNSEDDITNKPKES
jgi:general secretion pathway protein G